MWELLLALALDQYADENLTADCFDTLYVGFMPARRAQPIDRFRDR